MRNILVDRFASTAGTFFPVKVLTQQVWYSLGVILCPLVILLFIWWPMAVIIGALALMAVGVALIFLGGHLVGGLAPNQSMFSLERTLSTINITKDLRALEGQTYRMFTLEASDQSEEVRRRFLVAINAVSPELQDLPRELINGVSKKILYEYQRKTGTLQYRLGGRRPLVNHAELMRRLPNEERDEFLSFCRTN